MSRNAPDAQSFKRVLSFGDLVIFGMMYMVPVAPWFLFGFLDDTSGHKPALAYALGTLCMYFTARSYAAMAARVPRAGSVFTYASVALGPFAGFLAGWLMLLDYILFPALACVFAAVSLNSLVPRVPREAWVIGLVALALAADWFGVGFTARFNKFFFAVQLAALAVFMVFAVRAVGSGQGGSAWTGHALWSPAIAWQAVLAGTALGVMSFLGFDGISTLSEEVKPAHGHLVGRAIVASLVITGALFTVQAMVLGDLSTGVQVSDAAAMVYTVAAAKLGVTVGAMTAWVATVAAIVVQVPMLTAVARLIFAMARDGRLPGGLGRMHPRHGTPHMAMLLTSVVSLVVGLGFVNNPDVLTSIINFGALGGFVLVNLSVLRHFRGTRAIATTWTHGVMPLVGVAINFALLFSLGKLALMLGAAWLAAGLAIWLGLGRRPGLILEA